MTKMSDFTKLYQLSHTLKFELRPIGKTLENLQNSGLLEEDFKRSQDYAEVKSVLDEVHKKFLQDVLSDCDLSWQELADALKIFQINKDRKVLEDVQKKYRKLLADKFNKNEFFKILTEATPSKLFRHLLAQPDITEQKVETFGKFACYFKGYQENRKNIYSAEAQQTAAAYRAVNENFIKYLRVVELYDSFVKNFPELVEDIRQRTAELTDEDLSQVLQVENYNKFVAQSGIEYLNSLIAQINSAVNLYRQAHKVRLSFVPLLFKQILSDREQGFAIERIENDDDLYEKLKVFCGRHISNVEIRGETGDLFSRLKVLLTTLNDDCDLYVDATSLSAISNALTGNWSCFRDAMDAYANEILKNKGLREKYCKQPVYSFREIKNWGLVKSDDNGNVHPVCLTDYWHGEKALDMFRSEKDIYNLLLDMGYTYLFNFMDAMLSLYGFDLYCGVYHRFFYQRKSLVCDMVEPFRCIIDRRLRKAYNLRQIDPADFFMENGCCRLAWKAQNKYIKLFFKDILSEKEKIFIFCQEYYRWFIRDKPMDLFPNYEIGSIAE